MTTVSAAGSQSLKTVDTALHDIETWAKRIAESQGKGDRVKVDGSLTAAEISLVANARNSSVPLADEGEARNLADAMQNARKLVQGGRFTQEGLGLALGNEDPGPNASIEYNPGNVGSGEVVSRAADTTRHSGPDLMGAVLNTAGHWGDLYAANNGPVPLEQLMASVLGQRISEDGMSVHDVNVAATSPDSPGNPGFEKNSIRGTTLTPPSSGGGTGPVTPELLESLGLRSPEVKGGSQMGEAAGLPFAGAVPKFGDRTTFSGASGQGWDVTRSMNGSNDGGRFETYDVARSNPSSGGLFENRASVAAYESGKVVVSSHGLANDPAQANKTAEAVARDLQAGMGAGAVVKQVGPGRFEIATEQSIANEQRAQAASGALGQLKPGETAQMDSPVGPLLFRARTDVPPSDTQYLTVSSPTNPNELLGSVTIKPDGTASVTAYVPQDPGSGPAAKEVLDALFGALTEQNGGQGAGQRQMGFYPDKFLEGVWKPD